ncbi:MAG: DsbE family thiol:disulfide interchange protein [Gammaproteobacteria bacterium]|nr:MAG: DsbE family thiol:disulfide interchange protein [Gammaproteobacteria bacterium]
MSRYLVPGGFLLLILLFWFTLDRIGSGEYNPRDIPTEFIGRAAPQINVPDLYNPEQLVQTADMKGQVWLFNVWGTWCPECWREHDYLLKLGKTIPIVGLNWRDEASESKAMLARLGNPFTKIGFDPHSNVAIEWGVYGAPETFLIDEQGIIRAKHAGAMNPQVWVEKFLPHINREPGKP